MFQKLSRYYLIALAVWLAFVLFVNVSQAFAQDCSIFNPYSQAWRDKCQGEPPPTPLPPQNCPNGYQSTPYGCLKPSEPEPQPEPEPEPAPTPNPVPEPEPAPTPNDPEPAQQLWRNIPETMPGDVFAAVDEQGPAFPLDMIALKGPVPAFAWYAPSVGGLWLIVDGVRGPERICTFDFPAGLRIASLDLDDDGQEDLLAHDPRTGIVYRRYTRSLGHCGR